MAASSQLLRDPVIGPPIIAQSLGNDDDLLFAGMWRELFSSWICRIEDVAKRDSAGTFTAPDLLLQHFPDTFSACQVFQQVRLTRVVPALAEGMGS